MIDLADRAFIDELDSFHLVGEGTALGAHLDHAVVFPGRGHHLSAFENVVAGGFST
jgi:hypothetical protein